jgi:hypothetical protein
MSPPEPPSYVPSALSRRWTGRLAAYRNHRNDEHREALVEDALRFCGLHLEDSLRHSAYWSDASLGRRVAVLLFLVDRGVVNRNLEKGRFVYNATVDAEAWVASQPSLAPYLFPALELLAALRDHQARRLLAAD